jgi:hypothetical protein
MSHRFGRKPAGAGPLSGVGAVGGMGPWVAWALGLGLYYYGDDHGAAAVVVADPFADDAAG